MNTIETIVSSADMFAIPKWDDTSQSLYNTKYLRMVRQTFFKNCLHLTVDAMNDYPDYFDNADSLIEMLSEFLDSDESFDESQFSRSNVGYAFRLMMDGDNNERLNGVFNTLLLLSFSSKKEIAWSLNVPFPMTIMLMGKSHQIQRQISFKRNVSKISVSFDENSFIYNIEPHTQNISPTDDNCYILLDGKKINIILVNENNQEYYLNENERLFSSPPSDLVRDLQSAAKYLEQFSPMYAKWTADILQEIVVIGRTPQVTINRSATNIPGAIVLSYPPSEPDDYPQIMVHEATHNYLHACSVLSPLVNDSDEKLYYSPIKKTERPLEAILMTYHAFANVILFLDACKSAGAENVNYINREISDTFKVIDPLIPYLDETQGLTAMGEKFWSPLFPHISKLGFGGNHE